MRLRSTLLLLVCGLFLALSGVSQATPVTYFFDDGSVTIDIKTGGSTLLSTTLDLDGAFVTFDEAVPELVDFRFTLPDSGELTLSPPYGGRDRFTIHAANITPGSGYSGTGVTPLNAAAGNFAYTVGPIDSTVRFSALNSSGPPPPNLNNATNTLTSPSATGSLTINSTVGELSMTGITIGSVGPVPGESEPLVITGDFFFRGVVPEPSSAALVGFGLLGLLGAARRMQPKG